MRLVTQKKGGFSLMAYIYDPIKEDRTIFMDLSITFEPVPAFRLVLRRDLLRAPDPGTVRTMAREVGLSSANFDTTDLGEGLLFGFDEALAVERADEQEVTFLGRIPQFEFLSDRDCLSCGGRDDKKGDCFSCYGSGKETTHRHEPLNALMQSLSLLTNQLPHRPYFTGPDDLVAGNELQLFIPSLNVHYEAGWVGGWMTPAMMRWVWRTLSVDHPGGFDLPLAMEAMRRVSKVMCPTRSGAEEDEIRAYVRNDGWLIIDCPGEACSVYPDKTSFRDGGGGCEMICHNVDGAWQMVYLLAGMAAQVAHLREAGVGRSLV